jgi:hypothetical protein
MADKVLETPSHVRRFQSELDRNDYSWSKWLRDAVRCGDALVGNSRNCSARQEATQIAKVIRAAFGEGLTCEDDLLWHGRVRPQRVSQTACDAESRYEAALHLFAIEITSVSFANDSDARVKQAGRALREFANIFGKTNHASIEDPAAQRFSFCS